MKPNSEPLPKQLFGRHFNNCFVLVGEIEFKVLHTKPFDTAYMRQLYEFGYQQAAGGYHWAKQPPTLAGYNEEDASP